MMTIGSLLGSGCSLGEEKGEVSLSLSGGQQPWSGLLFPLASLRLEPRHVLPVDSAVISCFESEGPGLNILLASFNLNRELAITVLSFPQTATFGSSYGLFPQDLGWAEEQGEGWLVKTQRAWEGNRKPIIRAGETGGGDRPGRPSLLSCSSTRGA